MVEKTKRAVEVPSRSQIQSGESGKRRVLVRGTFEREMPMHVPLDKLWNEGEKFCQAQLGKRKHVDDVYAKTVFKEVPDMNVWRFLEQRHVVYVAAMDPETGYVWSSPVFANSREDKQTYASMMLIPKEVRESDIPTVSLASELKDASSFSEQEHDADEIERQGEFIRGAGDLVREDGSEVMYVRPWDPCAAGSAIGTLISPFQASSYESLVSVKNRKTIQLLKAPDREDPIWDCLKKPGTLLSLNFLEYETRKRWRINGSLTVPLSEKGFEMRIEEMFATCPRYITERTVVALHKEPPGETIVSKEPTLTDDLIRLITHADTCLIATIAPGWGADSSHRAGRPGFIRVIDKRILMWADYHGMYKFQTLGNTVLYPYGGLLFIDYYRGHTLQLTGKMKLHFLREQKQYFLDGRNRVVTFEVEKWIYKEHNCPFKWRLLKFSSTNPIMSDSSILQDMYSKEHGHKCEVVSNIEPFRELGVIHARVREVLAITKDVKSFVFESTDGQEFEYMSGMWATFTMEIDGERVMRNWTISSGNCTLLEGISISPDEFFSDTFEITVKKSPTGVTSPWLHDNVKPGMEIILNGMEGTFTLNASRRILLRDLSIGKIGRIGITEEEKEKVMRKREELLRRPGREWWKILMISGGIGITPIIGMFRSLKIMCHERGIMTKDQLPHITFLHSEHTIDGIAFKDEFRHYYCGLGDAPIIDRMAFVLDAEDANEKPKVLAKLREQVGRNSEDTFITAAVGEFLTAEFLEESIPDIENCMTMMCGPPKFMEITKKNLLSVRVPAEHILSENFSD